MTVWKKTKLMLGLAADEEYDDGYDDLEHGEPLDPGAHPEDRRPGHRPAVVRTGGNGGSLVMKPQQPMAARAQPQRQSQRSVVRPIPAATTVKPHVMSPSSFNDAQEVGDKFRGKQPVIVSLQNLDRDLSRRFIDFASGLCYGLGGRMEKVADHVYLLTPTDVEVSAEERQQLRDRGLHDD